MASYGKQMMDKFYALSREALKREEYDAAQVFSHAEGVVNDFLHGVPFSETYEKTRAALIRSSDLGFMSQGEKVAYLEAVKVLDEFYQSIQ